MVLDSSNVNIFCVTSCMRMYGLNLIFSTSWKECFCFCRFGNAAWNGFYIKCFGFGWSVPEISGFGAKLPSWWFLYLQFSASQYYTEWSQSPNQQSGGRSCGQIRAVALNAESKIENKTLKMVRMGLEGDQGTGMTVLRKIAREGARHSRWALRKKINLHMEPGNSMPHSQGLLLSWTNSASYNDSCFYVHGFFHSDVLPSRRC